MAWLPMSRTGETTDTAHGCTIICSGLDLYRMDRPGLLLIISLGLAQAARKSGLSFNMSYGACCFGRNGSFTMRSRCGVVKAAVGKWRSLVWLCFLLWRAAQEHMKHGQLGIGRPICSSTSIFGSSE